MYWAETRRLGLDDDGMLWRKGRETSRRSTEPRRLGHVTEPATSWLVSQPLWREFERLQDEWFDCVNFAEGCRLAGS